MKVRVRFTKEGEMRYVGHLDIMRYFQKAIRRANFDIAYSNGFSPHQIISFASPLGLGMTSAGEYFDAEFNSIDSSELMVKKFNEVMAQGIRVISFKVLPDGVKTNAMASLSAAEYELSILNNLMDKFDAAGGLNKVLEKMLSKDEIIIRKVTKRKESLDDIKPLIYSINSKDTKINMFIAAGSKETLKVSSVMDALLSEAGIGISGQEAFVKGLYEINRIDQFTLNNGKYISLSEVGVNYE